MINSNFDTFFYANFTDTDSKVQLDPLEVSHLQVFRPQVSQALQLSNGIGLTATATILSISKKECLLEIDLDSFQHHQKPLLSLALSHLKGKDLEEVIEACCQLDIHKIQVLRTQNSQEFKKADPAKQLQRLQQKSRVCTKQARKAWETQVLLPQTLDKFLKQDQAPKILLDPKPGLKKIPTEDYWVLCGPEGGFSVEEIKAILATPQATTLSLGPSRIRAKSAPAFALGVLEGFRQQS